MALITDSLVIAKAVPGGFSCTLVSRLGQMLTDLEVQFGQRDRAFTVLGVEFRDGNPQLYFPGNCGHVVIQLSLSAMNDPSKAIFQLAHESVHLLDPAPGGANFLEEGVATLFSIDFMQRTLGRKLETGDARYDTAARLVRSLVAGRCDAPKELRRLHGRWRSVSKEQIGALCPTLDLKIAEQLASSF